MKMIAAATVIRGEGECEVYMNHIVNEEMRRLNEQHRRERDAMREEMGAAKEHRDELLTDRLVQVRARTARRHGRIYRLREALANAWAMLWAIGGEIGLWTWEDENADRAS